MHDYENRMRLDIDLEARLDEITGHRLLIARLDPERYRVIERDGECLVEDTFDSWVMPVAEVRRMIEEAVLREPTGQGQLIGNAHAYIAQRRREIPQLLRDGRFERYQFVDRSEELLASMEDGTYGFAVLSLDIVGSTALSRTANSLAYADVLGITLRELAQVAPYFHAQILKFTGDGIIAYIPPPSFLTANDNAMDCALTMRGLIRDAVNPSIAAIGLPTLSVRIGVESGDAVALTIGHPNSKQHRDLLGNALNMACKIQESASAGEIRLGEVAYRNIHTMWKKGCAPVTRPGDWPYTLPGGEPYLVYTFVASGAITGSRSRPSGPRT